MRDKRQYQRAVLQVKVSVLPRSGATWETWETQSFDISVGGMLLAGQSAAKIGEEVTLAFELPKLGKVQMPGFVRWTSERGIGIQFGLIGPRETHAIGGLVRQQAVAS